MSRTFTGKHMATLLIAGFGVVIAVNLVMATLAVAGFSGVVVENSYVASQRFNGWLRQAKRQEALGWQAKLTRLDDGRVALLTAGVPNDAAVSASLRRPLGEAETFEFDFGPAGSGRFVSTVRVAPGRWTARIRIAADGQKWISEGPLT